MAADSVMGLHDSVVPPWPPRVWPCTHCRPCRASLRCGPHLHQPLLQHLHQSIDPQKPKQHTLLENPNESRVANFGGRERSGDGRARHHGKRWRRSATKHAVGDPFLLLHLPSRGLALRHHKRRGRNTAWRRGGGAAAGGGATEAGCRGGSGGHGTEGLMGSENRSVCPRRRWGEQRNGRGARV
jgi:hypothetical protein